MSKWASRRLAFSLVVFAWAGGLLLAGSISADNWTTVASRVVELYLGARAVEHVAAAVARRKNGGDAWS